jgi:hypothetical protein
MTTNPTTTGGSSSHDTIISQESNDSFAPFATNPNMERKDSIFKGVECIHSTKILEIKEEADALVVKGYIATTHFDGQDRIRVETLKQWMKEINDGIPRANKVSVNHNRIPHPAGVGVKGTARLDRFPDGEFGLFVESKIDKTREDYDAISYRIKEGFLDSFSIEYIAADTAPVINGVRILGPETTLHGWTLASQPMNEHAVMIKEFYKNSGTHAQQKEEKTMEEKTNASTAVSSVVPSHPQIGGIGTGQSTPDNVGGLSVGARDDANLGPTNTGGLGSKTAALEDYEKRMAAKMDMMRKEISESFETKMKSMVQEKVMPNKGDTMETKEQILYREVLQNPSAVSVDEQFKRAGEMLDQHPKFKEIGGLENWKSSSVESRASKMSFKGFKTNGSKLEFKGLGITTNANTDSDYTGLASAELEDIFDPVIYNALNEKVGLFNMLAKDDFSRKGNNQVQFRLKIAANTTVSTYAGNSITLGNTTRIKYMTKFKKYAVGIEVDGDMIASARGGPIGDVFALEVQDGTESLYSKMNVDLFGTGGLETDLGVIGLQYIANTGTYTSLYNVTRSSANKLAPTTATDTYKDGTAGVTKALLRAAVEQCVVEGSNLKDLFFVMHPRQFTMCKALFDNGVRMDPDTKELSFTGQLSFEGVPLVVDKDCTNTMIFCVDKTAHRLAFWVPPTLEMLGKRNDSTEGFVKTYWASYNVAPRRIAMIYSLPTA